MNIKSRLDKIEATISAAQPDGDSIVLIMAETKEEFEAEIARREIMPDHSPGPPDRIILWFHRAPEKVKTQ